jgi:V8-like Glu-specific endopeptidase
VFDRRTLAIVGIVSLDSLRLGTAIAQEPSESREFGYSTSSSKEALWTKKRYRAASPMPIPVETEEPIRRGQSRWAEQSNFADQPSADSAGSNYVPGNVDLAPLNAAGKLFLTLPSGSDTWCSAQFITPSVVLTAAHCVRDNKSGRWFKDLEFQQRYRYGKSFRIFKVACVSTYNQWVSKYRTRWVYDYAMILVKTDPSKPNTAHFGWYANWTRNMYSTASKIGYAGNIKDGEEINVESNKQLMFNKKEPYIIGLNHGNNKFTYGASGGGVVGGYMSTNAQYNNRVISVTSFIRLKKIRFIRRKKIHSHIITIGKISYGPYFDNDFVKMLAYVQKGCR